MVDSLATTALETLRDLLIEEAKFLYGVSGQVEQVQRDLKTMHSFLMDADKWSDRYDPASLRDWVTNLIDLASVEFSTPCGKYYSFGRHQPTNTTKSSMVGCQTLLTKFVHMLELGMENAYKRASSLNAKSHQAISILAIAREERK
ncbi:hypothetical protein DH2020_005180 [Rehmannia glutinosa]|uniref:Disease resistance N-terminal domain-containing protein n=1 Tax=Rehmannia glutinosa TaxID=99300 RepID=A0ABR0XRP0_REHGL